MTLFYMLDTNAVSYALRGEGRVHVEIAKRKPSTLCLSSLSVAELRYGATRQKSVRLQAAIGRFAETIRIVPFGEPEAATYGYLMDKLEAAGTPLHAFDALIAAHAITLNLTLITRDKAFEHVTNLCTTNWY